MRHQEVRRVVEKEIRCTRQHPALEFHTIASESWLPQLIGRWTYGQT